MNAEAPTALPDVGGLGGPLTAHRRGKSLTDLPLFAILRLGQIFIFLIFCFGQGERSRRCSALGFAGLLNGYHKGIIYLTGISDE